MNQDQLNVIKNQILYSTDDSDMRNLEVKLYEKNNLLCLDINARDIYSEYIWRGVNIKIIPKSLDHVDRIIIAIKQLLKEISNEKI